MNKIKAIIGVDPGGTTGLAAYYPTAGFKDGNEASNWHRMEMPDCSTDKGMRDTIKMIRGLYSHLHPFLAKPTVHIVMERFEFRRDERYRDKIDYTPAEMIGAIRFAFGDTDFIKLHMAGAAIAKGFWTDDKLKQIGLWVPNLGHAMDATRHVLRYRTFQLEETSLLRVFKPHVDEPNLSRLVEETPPL